MKLESFKKLIDGVFRHIEDPIIRETVLDVSIKIFEKSMEGYFRNEHLPELGQSVAVTSENPKTASLFFDRVFFVRGPDTVPENIRICVPSFAFLVQKYLQLLLLHWIELRESTDTTFPARAVAQDLEKTAARIVNVIAPEFVQMANSGAPDSEYLKAFWDCILVFHSYALKEDYRVDAIPLFPSLQSFSAAYRNSGKMVGVASLSNLRLVDEESLEWSQIQEFRKDSHSVVKVRRLLHWFDSTYADKPMSFIEDDVSFKLLEYEDTLKRNGIKTVLGTLSAVLDGKFVFGSSAASLGIGLMTRDPIWALLAEGILVGSKVILHVAQQLLEYSEVGRGENAEIAIIHELRKKYGSRRT